MEEVNEVMADSDCPSLDMLRKLMDTGVNQAPHPAVERSMAQLQELLTVGETWEEKAKHALQTKPSLGMSDLENLAKDASDVPLNLPSVQMVKDVLRKARDWNKKVEAVKCGDKLPYLDTLEPLASKARQLPVDLELLSEIDSVTAAVKMWKERTELIFLKRNSDCLIEVCSSVKRVLETVDRLIRK